MDYENLQVVNAKAAQIKKIEADIEEIERFPYDRTTARIVLSHAGKELILTDIPITTKQLVEWTISSKKSKIDLIKKEMADL